MVRITAPVAVATMLNQLVSYGEANDPSSFFWTHNIERILPPGDTKRPTVMHSVHPTVLHSAPPSHTTSDLPSAEPTTYPTYPPSRSFAPSHRPSTSSAPTATSYAPTATSSAPTATSSPSAALETSAGNDAIDFLVPLDAVFELYVYFVPREPDATHEEILTRQVESFLVGLFENTSPPVSNVRVIVEDDETIVVETGDRVWRTRMTVSGARENSSNALYREIDMVEYVDSFVGVSGNVLVSALREQDFAYFGDVVKVSTELMDDPLEENKESSPFGATNRRRFTKSNGFKLTVAFLGGFGVVVACSYLMSLRRKLKYNDNDDYSEDYVTPVRGGGNPALEPVVLKARAVVTPTFPIQRSRPVTLHYPSDFEVEVEHSAKRLSDVSTAVLPDTNGDAAFAEPSPNSRASAPLAPYNGAVNVVPPHSSRASVPSTEYDGAANGVSPPISHASVPSTQYNGAVNSVLPPNPRASAPYQPVPTTNSDNDDYRLRRFHRLDGPVATHSPVANGSVPSDPRRTPSFSSHLPPPHGGPSSRPLLPQSPNGHTHPNSVRRHDFADGGGLGGAPPRRSVSVDVSPLGVELRRPPSFANVSATHVDDDDDHHSLTSI